MATSGSGRRLVAAGVAGFAAVACLGGLAGCSRSTAAPRRAATSSATPVARSVPPFAAFCAGPAVAHGLSRVVPGSLDEEVVPLGVSSDGRTGFVSLWTRSFSGVAALNLGTGAFRPIWRFTNPGADQADGAFDGRWLVWEETYSLQSLDNFTVYAWNAVSGKVLRIGHSLAGRRGVAWPSPWHAPAVHGNYAAWAQGSGPGGAVQIRLADLRTGRVTVVAAGHLQAPFFDGSLLAWPASGRPGAETSLHAYSLSADAPVPLPVVLRAVRGTDFVVADGMRTAYLNPALTELYYSPNPGEPAHVMLRLSAGTEFSGLGLGATSLTWTTTEATYAASTVTGGYVQVTPAYGFAVPGAGPAILVSDSPADKSGRPVLPLREVTLRAAFRHRPRTQDRGRRARRCARLR